MALLFGGTSLLLHGDGNDGSTVFTDETGKTVTAYGNAKISTTQSKFGGSSMYFDGVGSYISAPALLIDRANFTIEFFLMPEALPSSEKTLFKFTSLFIDLTVGSSGGLFIRILSNNYSGSCGTVVAGAFSHICLRVNAGVFKVSVNGSDTYSQGVPLGFNNGTMFIGGGIDGAYSSGSIQGWVDDFRVVSGIATYPGVVTVPVEALQVVTPVAVQIQPLTPYGPPLAKYNPAIGKPVMQAITTDLTDRLPYGIPNSSYTSGSNLVVPFEFKGRGRITGTVKNTPNQPVWRLLRLYREPGGLLVKSLWSDPVTGAYSFDGISMGYRYTVVSYDHTGQYRAVIADNQIPDLIP